MWCEQMSKDNAPERVVVTGGNGGIGGAIVRRYLSVGAEVVSIDVANDPPEGARMVRADISVLEDVDRAFGKIDGYWGGQAPDVFIGCAAISRPGHLLDFDVDNFDRMFAINVRGTFLTTQMAARRMASTRRGAIVLVSSIAAQQAWAHEGAYSATKAATSSLTQGFAVDLAQFGISVNAVAPGPIESDSESMATTRTDPDVYRHEIERTPMARLGSPEEVAETVYRLAGLPWVTGQILAVDGGFMATGLGYFGTGRDKLTS